MNDFKYFNSFSLSLFFNTALTREGDYSEYLAKFNFLISVKFQISFLIPFISSAFCAIKLSPNKKGDYYLYYAQFP